MTNVIAAVTADACARPVLDTAAGLADLLGATVVALHVREQGVPTPKRLAEAAGVELCEVSGPPIPQIVTAAKQPDIAALVLGARGAHADPGPAGHTALQVITQLAKPVVVVPPRAHPRRRLARILVPLEGTAESSRALDDTIRLAHRHQLEVLVLHVHSPATVPAFSDHEPHATRAWDQEFINRHLPAPHDRVRLLRRLGEPAEDVIAVARETSADLVVLAWSQELGESRAHVVSGTLARSDVPVLLLPVPLAHRRSKRRGQLRRSPHADSAPDHDAIARARG
jgi:nucleotide-binding universal stress UspA family protein